MNQSNKALREKLERILHNLTINNRMDTPNVKRNISEAEIAILALVTNHIKGKMPEKWDEGDGWDIAFSQSDQIKMMPDGSKKVIKKGKARSCCPGDDIAYVRNLTIDEVNQILKEMGE